MWMPFSTPAGILTLTVRRVRTRPSPEHSGHGVRITLPKPLQRGHGREVITWPRNERCTCCTSPRPMQVSQVSGWVPGAQPDPSQVVHTTAVSIVSSRVVPKAVSARSSSTRSVALRPRRARVRGPREVAVPKKASMMSLNGKPAPPNGPAPPAPPPGANGSAPRSYISRFLGSESTSYAWVISLNRSWVSGSGLTSGCSSRASRRYAFLISSGLASRRTPKVA